MILFYILFAFALANLGKIAIAKYNGEQLMFTTFNACGLVGTSGSAGDCVNSKGGITLSRVADYDDIATVVVDADGNVTDMTFVGGTTPFVDLTPDDNDQAYYNQEGSRDGNSHEFAQTSFFTFAGLSLTKREMGNNIKNCCALICVHRTSTGEILIQGIETDGATTSHTTSFRKAKATVNFLTDTADNNDRLEITIESTAIEMSPMAASGVSFDDLTTV